MPRKDTLETWKENGTWPEYREIIAEAAINNYSDGELASCLNITQATLITLKKKHPEIIQIMMDAKKKDRVDLLANIRKLAKGDKVTIQRKVLKRKGGKVVDEQVIGETVQEYAPNLNANEYLLAVVHGEQYSVPFRRMKLMEQKAIEDMEVMNNARSIGQDSDEEN